MTQYEKYLSEIKPYQNIMDKSLTIVQNCQDAMQLIRRKYKNCEFTTEYGVVCCKIGEELVHGIWCCESHAKRRKSSLGEP